MNNLILEASRYAEWRHRGQIRKYTGEPYIFHPARVAARVSFSRHSYVDEELVAVAWLHDVIEDCGVTYETLRDMFGAEIASRVDELTNPSKKFPHLKRYQRKAMDLEHIKIISWPSKIVKICDRIDNLNDYPVENEDAFKFVREKYYKESIDLYEVVKDVSINLAHDFQKTLEEIREKFSIGE